MNTQCDRAGLIAYGLDRLPDGFAVFDQERVLIESNAAFCTLGQYPTEVCQPGVALETLLQYEVAHSELACTDHEEGVAERIARISRLELRSTERDVGDGQIVSTCYDPLPHGGVLVTSRDVTELRQAERKLEANATRLAELKPLARRRKGREELALEVIGQGIYDWDIAGGSIYYSGGFQKVLGLRKEELQTTEDWLKRIHPEDLPRVLHAHTQHFKGETERFELEYRYRGNEGELRWVRHHGLARRDEHGRAYRMVGWAENITEEKRLATALERAQGQLEDALEAISEGFVLYDHEDRLVICNTHYQQFFADAAGAHVAALLVPGADRDTIMKAAFEHGMFPDRGGTSDEFLAWWRDNLLSAVHLRLGSGAHVQIEEQLSHDAGIVGVFTDITELKKREAELAELVDHLTLARDAAMAATRAKSQFVANMSHELRTPLNAVIGITEMLEEDARDDGQDDYVEPLERISQAGRHLLQLINEILDLSKVEAGRLELQVEEIDVAALVSELAAIARPLADEKGNCFTVHCVDSLGTMHADSVRVRQVVLNLLSNACKFTDGGEVRLVARRQANEADEWIQFEVTDTGIGIAPEQQDKVFEEFSQADESTTRKYGGTGLGLAISRRLCRMMGGDIELTSELGAGSTFVARLPVQTKGVSDD